MIKSVSIIESCQPLASSCIAFIAMLCVACAGCQLGPGTSSPSLYSQQSKLTPEEAGVWGDVEQIAGASSEPAFADTRSGAIAQLTSTDATIRGQSGDGWQTSGTSYPQQPTNRYSPQSSPPQSLPTPPATSGTPNPPQQNNTPNTTNNPSYYGNTVLQSSNDSVGSSPSVGAPVPRTSYQSPYGGYPQAGYPQTGGTLPAPAYGGGQAYGGTQPLPYSQPSDPYSPSDYGSTIAPGAYGANDLSGNSAIAPGVFPSADPMAGIGSPIIGAPGGYQPNTRIAPIDVYVQEARTGRITFGGSVNSDLGVAGQIVIDERNFDIRRFPRSWSELGSGRAFRGAGQNFRMELMPGNLVERYTVSWSERNLFGYLPYSLSVGGFYYTRQFRDWTEQRIGGRVALGYEVTKDLSVSSELRLEDVTIFDPRLAGISDLDSALGSNDMYTARFRVAHDTRDSPFMSTEGALLELVYDQVFGEYDYPRGQINYSRYFLMKERADGTGRHTLASTFRLGFSGSQTPIFENYFAGGYSTLRGFSFRGASPKDGDVQVGGEFMFLGSLEYLFPLTADEMLRGVAFVDYGTIERDIEINQENFRVAPGVGLRVSVPALGPAPLAFDFAFPVSYADSDDRQIFSFFMGFTR